MPSVFATAALPDDFQQLLAANRGIVLKIAASYCFQIDERADLVQDIDLQLWRAWPSFDRKRPFATWLYQVALNVAISHRRSGHQRPRHEPIEEAHEQLVGASDVDAIGMESLAIVQRAMRALGPMDRALLLLRLEGCSHREVGQVLGISESNAATRLGRVRQQLRAVAAADTHQGERHDRDA